MSRKNPKRNQYMLFQNCCEVCGCPNGQLFHKFSRLPPMRDEIVPGHHMGHVIHLFKCSDCGAITAYERVPVVFKVFFEDNV